MNVGELQWEDNEEIISGIFRNAGIHIHLKIFQILHQKNQRRIDPMNYF